MASNSFNPLSLITSPISGAFGLAGSKAQANAQEQASQLQYQAATNALNFAMQKQNQATQQAQPYLAIGQGAVQALPGMVRPSPSYGAPTPYGGLGTNPIAPMTGAYPTSLSGMGQPMSTGPQQGATPTRINLPTANTTPGFGVSTAPTAGMTLSAIGTPTAAPTSSSPVSGASQATGQVLMQAPDGTQQYVPVNQVAFYTSRGATVING